MTEGAKMISQLNRLYTARSRSAWLDSVQKLCADVIGYDLFHCYFLDKNLLPLPYQNGLSIYQPGGTRLNSTRKLFDQHPFRGYALSGGQDMVLRLSDFLNPDDRSNRINHWLQVRLGCRYVLGMRLGARPEGIPALSLKRKAADFSAVEIRRAQALADHINRSITRAGKALPDLPPEELRKRIRAAFRLTLRETELALHVMQGESPAKSAALMGISVLTISGYLHSIYCKTGVSSRAELVSLLWSVAG